jgi:hypothetical protein
MYLSVSPPANHVNQSGINREECNSTAALLSAPNYEELWESGVYSCIMEVSDKIQAPVALFPVPTAQKA